MSYLQRPLNYKESVEEPNDFSATLNTAQSWHICMDESL